MDIRFPFPLIGQTSVVTKATTALISEAPDSRVAILTGESGSGRSRLAAAIAAGFPGRVLHLCSVWWRADAPDHGWQPLFAPAWGLVVPSADAVGGLVQRDRFVASLQQRLHALGETPCLLVWDDADRPDVDQAGILAEVWASRPSGLALLLVGEPPVAIAGQQCPVPALDAAETARLAAAFAAELRLPLPAGLPPEATPVQLREAIRAGRIGTDVGFAAGWPAFSPALQTSL
ncbi:MAG: hypothetical protein H7338_09505, partial [Candidatus Sericytochromatia bacterium]|nr:hypothetical protein [Candidatus Sericytochromatia bacterium]